MQKLALQREAEQRELERQRKEEWARRRQLELEGQREWERKTLRSLMDQHLELEEKLNQLVSDITISKSYVMTSLMVINDVIDHH